MVLVAGVEIKRPDKHVEADTDVVSGRGFDSPRLQSLTPLPSGSGVFLFRGAVVHLKAPNRIMPHSPRRRRDAEGTRFLQTVLCVWRVCAVNGASRHFFKWTAASMVSKLSSGRA